MQLLPQASEPQLTDQSVVLVTYPKSGTHLAMAILRESGIEPLHRHNVAEPMRKWGRVDLHVVRHPYDVAVSWACHFHLRRPELNPARIAKVMPRSIREVAGGAFGFGGWAKTVDEMRDAATVTVRFEDLRSDPEAALAPLAVDVSAGAGILRRTGMRNTLTFRRGRSGEWRDVVAARPELAEVLEDNLGDAARSWGFATDKG